jgi:hypothetical protein
MTRRTSIARKVAEATDDERRFRPRCTGRGPRGDPLALLALLAFFGVCWRWPSSRFAFCCEKKARLAKKKKRKRKKKKKEKEKKPKKTKKEIEKEKKK